VETHLSPTPVASFRDLSLWWDSLPENELTARIRPPLGGDQHCDVAIVGGGLTGLWTAYYLAVAQPGMSITVLEREVAGFGASGRNGGWCSALFPVTGSRLDEVAGPGAGRAVQLAMNETVREVGRVAEAEGIDCHFAAGGTVMLARTPAQWERMQAGFSPSAGHEATDSDLRLLGADEARSMVGATNVLGGTFTPHCAAVDPARLTRGLAEVVERLGVTICEQTTVQRIEAGMVVTDHGTVRAPTVVRATEGYTGSITGLKRQVLPVYSLMIATEPLPESFWAEAGMDGRPTFADDRHMVIYGQRTADNRLAFGGRGAPYHFGSRIRREFDRNAKVHEKLHETLIELFPAVRDARITHRWGGALGISRDWFPSVGLDRASGLAWAGGYVGDGLATTNLAGRTLRDLILGQETELTSLAWVNHRSPTWEPEPARFLGINAGLLLAGMADRAEGRRGRTTWHAGLLEQITGH
jgi:glycine/D-amino acid oxidase-like deaminating enzyme